jgi:hypothetical protein
MPHAEFVRDVLCQMRKKVAPCGAIIGKGLIACCSLEVSRAKPSVMQLG